MTDFKVRCYHEDSTGNVIGAEVIIYDKDDVVDDILLVDKTKFDELSGKLNTLDSTYIDKDELKQYLENSNENNPINATLLNGLASDKFLKKDDINSYQFSPGAHSSNSTVYGVGTTGEYGHVKLVDHCNRDSCKDGEALSSHQGYVLNDKIDAINDSLSATKVETESFHHSKWKLYKSGNVVSLHVMAWTANSDVRNNYFNTNLVLPENCRPPKGVTIYIDDVVVGSQHIVIGDDGKIHAFIKSEGSGIFHGQATWITMEE